MNTLKALAKMTKLAASLQHQVDHSKGEFIALRMKYDDTVRVATERDTRIKELEAKLYAAEARAREPLNQMEKGFGILKELGYAWESNLGVWLPPQSQGRPPGVNWNLRPWATHFLTSKVGAVFAELVAGRYLGAPKSDVGHGRLCYQVGLGETDFRVLVARPGYSGPSTRGKLPPVLADHHPMSPGPAGAGWTQGASAARPADVGTRGGGPA